MRAEQDGVGIEFDVSGPEDGRPVILLHGFPDSGRVWRHQVPALAAAGFRVVTPDLRGFGRSDKPEAVDAYNMLFLAGDGAGRGAGGPQPLPRRPRPRAAPLGEPDRRGRPPPAPAA
ncbi:MAG: alpha/beta fold hydrolase, partial [Acidimicrobiales bacterium]